MSKIEDFLNNYEIDIESNLGERFIRAYYNYSPITRLVDLQGDNEFYDIESDQLIEANDNERLLLTICDLYEKIDFLIAEDLKKRFKEGNNE